MDPTLATDPVWLWILKTTPLYVLIPFGLMLINILVLIGIGIWEAFRPAEEEAPPAAPKCARSPRCTLGLPAAPLPKRMRTVAGRHHPKRRS